MSGAKKSATNNEWVSTGIARGEKGQDSKDQKSTRNNASKAKIKD